MSGLTAEYFASLPPLHTDLGHCTHCNYNRGLSSNIIFPTIHSRYKDQLLVMEGGGKVARVHHSQDVPHLQVLPGRVEWKVNLDNNLNILTHVNC